MQRAHCPNPKWCLAGGTARLRLYMFISQSIPNHHVTAGFCDTLWQSNMAIGRSPLYNGGFNGVFPNVWLLQDNRNAWWNPPNWLANMTSPLRVRKGRLSLLLLLIVFLFLFLVCRFSYVVFIVFCLSVVVGCWWSLLVVVGCCGLWLVVCWLLFVACR